MSMVGPELFRDQLRELGLMAELRDGFVFFTYKPCVGPLDGEAIEMALFPQDHPRTPPSGPFMTPRIMPIHPEGDPAPHGGVHVAHERQGFRDPDGFWEYWSRPFNDWDQHGRTAQSYLDVHLRRLFACLPADLTVPCAA